VLLNRDVSPSFCTLKPDIEPDPMTPAGPGSTGIAGQNTYTAVSRIAQTDVVGSPLLRYSERCLTISLNPVDF
jgi:hypothetical protein